ncbi:MAG TPA: hypothetical protein PLU22_04480 [Polyangiaceae bacterium]|nr:hypothetical protein [Polyangiaceae bacterium]
MTDSSFALDVWNKVLDSALALPGVKVNRRAYLYRELTKHVGPGLVERAILEGPGKAGVSAAVIDRIAYSSINWHTAGASALSFAAGLPGGWWLAGTIPADLAQYFGHCLCVTQKLAYLYGWPDLVDDEESLDDETRLRLTLFVGVMLGSEMAASTIRLVAARLAEQVILRLPQFALTKFAVYRLAREVAKWIGVQLTKDLAARSVAKLIPVVGGVISGSVTGVSFAVMGRRLRKHLADLPLARAR